MNRRYKEVQDSQVTISELMLPSHSNFSGKIHGGYILSLMDSVAFACASRHSENYCVTASVDKVDFLLPIEVGELVTMKSQINFTGKSSMVVGIRVESENIRTRIIKHCNSSYFTMVAKDNDGKNADVPGLILNDEEDIRRFLKSMYRIEMNKIRKSDFSKEEFSVAHYPDALKGQNVMLASVL